MEMTVNRMCKEAAIAYRYLITDDHKQLTPGFPEYEPLYLGTQ
jgi:hypothetical protein